MKFFTSFTGIISSWHLSAKSEPSWVHHGQVREAGNMDLSLDKAMYNAFVYNINTNIIDLI